MTPPRDTTHQQDDATGTGPTPQEDVDRAVLAGEPASAPGLEDGDDDLPPVKGEWAEADALLEGQPTELGE